MKTIYINFKNPEELRVLIVENGRLTGYEAEFLGRHNRKGDIYKGRITRVEPGLEAAFVDYGDGKDGFLPFRDIDRSLLLPGDDLPIAARVPPGGEMLVQIEKDRRGEKGAALTTHISLAGAFLVLMPLGRGKNSVSQQAPSKRRSETAAVLRELPVPSGMNVIVRTAGVGRGADELKWDLESYLSPLWRAIETAGSQQKAPLLIYREANLLVRAARSHIWGDIDRIVCDTPGSFREISDFLALVNPDMGSRVSYHEGDGDMLSEAIEAQVDRIFEREIGLPSGGKVVFDRTEALVAIDVNSARSRSGADIEETALTTNLEAAQAVALHLRLRDLSGLIVVDFIDMMSADNRAAVEREFRTLLRVDRAQVRSTGISQFGMMELSRQRLDTELDEAHGRACPTCNGAGRVRRSDSFALSLLRSLRAEAVKPKASAIFLRAPLETAVYLLNEKRIELRRLEDLGQCDIFVTPDADMNPPNYSLRLFADKTAGAEAAAAEEKAARAAKDKESTRQPSRRQPLPAVRSMAPQEPAPRRAAESSPESASSPAPDSLSAKASSLWRDIVKFFSGAAATDDAKESSRAAPERGRQKSRKGEPRGKEGKSPSRDRDRARDDTPRAERERAPAGSRSNGRGDSRAAARDDDEGRNRSRGDDEGRGRSRGRRRGGRNRNTGGEARREQRDESAPANERSADSEAKRERAPRNDYAPASERTADSAPAAPTAPTNDRATESETKRARAPRNDFASAGGRSEDSAPTSEITSEITTDWMEVPAEKPRAQKSSSSPKVESAPAPAPKAAAVSQKPPPPPPPPIEDDPRFKEVKTSYGGESRSVAAVVELETPTAPPPVVAADLHQIETRREGK